MNWKNAHETLDRHRSELERMNHELAELRDALADGQAVCAKARVVIDNIDKLTHDLLLVSHGVGVCRRIAEREAFMRGQSNG